MQQDTTDDGRPEPLVPEYTILWFFKFFSFRLHKAHRKNGVEDKSHDQGSRQCQDQYNRQIDHKLTNQSLP